MTRVSSKWINSHLHSFLLIIFVFSLTLYLLVFKSYLITICRHHSSNNIFLLLFSVAIHINFFLLVRAFLRKNSFDFCAYLRITSHQFFFEYFRNQLRNNSHQLFFDLSSKCSMLRKTICETSTRSYLNNAIKIFFVKT